jgi:hypothetical protein
MVIMSSYYRIFTVKFAILLSLYFIANFAFAHVPGQVAPSKNGNDSNKLIENEDNADLKSHRRLSSTTVGENGKLANVGQIAFSPSEMIETKFLQDGNGGDSSEAPSLSPNLVSISPSPSMASNPSDGGMVPSAEPFMVSSSPSQLHDGNSENSILAPSLSPNLVSISPSPSMASNPSVGGTVPSAEPSMVPGMVSSSPSQLQTDIPTSTFQKNTKDLNDNDDKEEESEGNENTSSNGATILYVVFSAVVAFGLVKAVQYKRRQVLMREREMVMTSPAYNSGHLDELRYVDENEII